MEAKVAAFANNGMRKDISISKSPNEFAFHNHNIRITARDKHTLLSVTNEKGNKQIEFKSLDKNSNDKELLDKFSGTIIGHAVLNNYLVLFIVDNYNSYIIRIEEQGDTFYYKTLYKGDLKFDVNYPIETLSYFEAQNIQKIYWVDGKNQPRMINIVASEEKMSKWKDTSFDFVQTFEGTPTIEIEKEYIGVGTFSAGVIQYAFSYYNKFGQETNFVYVSPLQYLSLQDRGAKEEESVNCSFKIKISNCDTSFDYVRIYSIIKNDYSGEIIAQVLTDLPITENKNEIIEYTDVGTNGTIIDPTILMYLGGVEISANTLNYKDGTLFLGNLELFNIVTKDLKEYIRNNCIFENGESKVISFDYISNLDTGNYKDIYPYKNQLVFSSDKIKTFKSKERYRFGVRFITKTGKKTDAIWVGDKTNIFYPLQHDNTTSNKTERAVAILKFDDATINKIKEYKDFVNCELLMVNPSVNERSILAQGIVLPTMFNLQQRCENLPYSISSWFTRPKLTNIANYHFSGLPKSDSFYAELPYVTTETHPYYKKEDYLNLESGETAQLKYWLRYDKTAGINKDEYFSIEFDIIINNNNESKILYEYRQSSKKWTKLDKQYAAFVKALKANLNIDSSQIPSYSFIYSLQKDAISSIDKKAIYTIDLDDFDKIKNEYFIQDNSEHFFIDESIVNLYSPEIEENQTIIDNNDLKFRIVGYANIFSNITDYDIAIDSQSLSPQAGVYSFNFNTNAGTYPDLIGKLGESDINPIIVTPSIEGLLSFPLWKDYYWVNDSTSASSVEWKVKKDHTIWQVYPWQKEGSLNYNPLHDLTDLSLNEYGSVVTSNLKRKIFANLRIANSTVYLDTKEMNLRSWIPEAGIYKPRVFNSNEASYLQFETPEGKKQYQGNYDNLVALNSSSINVIGVSKDYPGYHTLGNMYLTKDTSVYPSKHTTTEPVRIKYKTIPHVVFAFKENANQQQILLPGCMYPLDPLPIDIDGYTLPWNMEKTPMFKNESVFSKGFTFKPSAHVMIGELYRDLNIDSLYGGTTESALKTNVFIPISSVYKIDDLKTGIYGTEGDTYFQRWDCLKTYPFTEEDTNSVVDIVSCMLETHINLDGRCDINRNNLKNIYARPSNFNLINKVYSQINNNFPSFYLDEKFVINKYPTQITWTKSKNNTEEIDSWTNLTLAGIIELDGDKGKLSSIQKHNNSLIAFQDKGISEILFNARTLLSTDSGVPVEIGNTGKVEGYRYITEKIGCLNKWSIQSTSSGIYFVDDYNKAIMLLNEEVNDLSNVKGFNIWTKENCTLKEWKPLTFDNIVTYYDSVNNDLYFINDKTALVYSELLGEFTSFMDYQNTSGMYNFNNHFIAHKNDEAFCSLWLQNEGKYNSFFGELKNYYITFRVAPDQFKDKIFTNVEYKADIWIGDLLSDYTFDTLIVKNEYQEGSTSIKKTYNGISSGKKKFRTWRVNIPRSENSKYKQDRIRNPWIELTLKKEINDVQKFDSRMEFHNFIVKYFE